MFGDYFGQKSDYSSGLFYGGHRKYLNQTEISGLEPPDEFKTKRQHRLARANVSRQTDSRNDDRFNFQMNFQQKKQDENDVNDPSSNAKKFRRVANLVRNTITVDHFSSLHRDDWIEEYQAGIKLWVNKETGEVSTHCPWELDPTAFTDFAEQKVSPMDEEALGTGSLVYDSKELDELFAILDKNEARKK